MNDSVIYSARAYHEATKHRRGFVAPARRVDAALIPKQYKRYVDLPSLRLPSPGSSERTGLDSATLSTLLHYTAGIIRRREVGGRTIEFRAASCTGALYHVEIYVVCGDTGDIPAGVYHYDVPSETLRPLRAGDHRPHLAAACATDIIATAPATLVFTSTFWRNTWRYEERAYRHVFWDTGTVLANLLALTASRDLDTQVLTGFVDNDLATLLGLDPMREVPVCAVSIDTTTTSWTSPDNPQRVGAHSHAPTAAPDVRDPLAPNASPSEALSRAEIEYPLIWRTHEAANLRDPNAVTTWRARATRQHPLSSQARPEHGRRGEGAGGEVTPIESIITRRLSARRFKPEPISRPQLDALIDAAASPILLDAGVTDLVRTHLLAHAVEGLEPGAFHVEHPGTLTALRHANLRSNATALALDQPAAGDAAVNFYFTASVSDIETRLGDRGYRVAQIIAGIRSGRLYLAATALGVRATGLTFYDDEVATALNLDPQDTAVLMLMAAGR